MVTRAIGELARDVVARSFLKAMARGSFEPRKCAVVFDGGFAISGVRLILCRVPTEDDLLAANANLGDELRVLTVFPLGHALLETAPSPLVARVLSERGGPQVCDAVVVSITVDVVDQSVWALAGGEPPRQSPGGVDPAAEADQTIALVRETAGPTTPRNAARQRSNPNKTPALLIVGEM